MLHNLICLDAVTVFNFHALGRLDVYWVIFIRSCNEVCANETRSPPRIRSLYEAAIAKTSLMPHAVILPQ